MFKSEGKMNTFSDRQKLGKEYNKAIYCHTVYLTYIQTAVAAKSHQSCPTLCDPIDGSPPGSPVPTSCKIPDWIKHKLESRLPGEISITSDTQLKPGVLQSTGSQRVRHN